MSVYCAVPNCGQVVKPRLFCEKHMAAWERDLECLRLRLSGGPCATTEQINAAISAALERFIAAQRRS